MKTFSIKLTPENQAEVKAWFNKNFPDNHFTFNWFDYYYGIIDNDRTWSCSVPFGTLIKSMSELDEKEKVFPRYMMVGASPENCDYKRLILGKFKKCYISVGPGYEEEYFNDDEYSTCTWKYAKEIEEPKIIEVTIDDIAKLMNVNPEQIKIKK